MNFVAKAALVARSYSNKTSSCRAEVRGYTSGWGLSVQSIGWSISRYATETYERMKAIVSFSASANSDGWEVSCFTSKTYSVDMSECRVERR